MDEYNKIWSPYKIKLILHASCITSPWPARSALIYRDTINELVSLGLVTECTDECIITTERGNALVSMWCMTPLPEQVWIDPRSGKPA